MLKDALLDNLKIRLTTKMHWGACDLFLSEVLGGEHREKIQGGGEGKAS